MEEPDEQVRSAPEAIKEFCDRQCTDEINGIPMFVRGCYDECVKDLVRKQGVWKRIWKQGVSRSDR